MKKIVMIGPESSGKTTLSEKLALAFNEPWVPEFAREYLLKLNRPYVKNDLLEIAKGQTKTEDELAVKSNHFLFCDTDLLVIKVWSEHIYVDCEIWIQNQINSRHYDFYFLCKNDFPWQSDPLRENPDLGDYFFDIFKNTLISMKKQFVILEGNDEERLLKAVEILKKLN